MKLFTPHAAITKSNVGVELGTVQQSVRTVSDTARVVVSLVVIGKCAPLGTGVDGALLQDEAAASADEITTRVILTKVWRILTTISAHETDIQVLHPLVVFRRHFYGLGESSR
jgi:hypothetical protein